MAKFQIAIDIDRSSLGTVGFLTRTLTTVAYEQFPYQESAFEELSRSNAWLVDGLRTVRTSVITEASLAEILGGVSLRETMGATFLLQTSALMNGGIFNPDWLNQEIFHDVLKIYPRGNIETIAKRLTTTPTKFRDAFRRQALGSSMAARYDYNPLAATPFVDMGDGIPVAPATRLILRTVSPGGLYYAGVKEYGSDFANDLGLLFEDYIGRQLRSIDGAAVEPEITFAKGGGSKSIDFFVIFPKLVVLVEVKSYRLGASARAGQADLFSALRSSLDRPRKQLARTMQKISERHQAFAHIPSDRQTLALIVTAEPFYTASAHLLEYGNTRIPGGSLPDVPLAVASARDIEALVTHGLSVEDLLLKEIQTKRDGGAVDIGAIGKNPLADNAILLESWNSYPWPD
ncbi:nuclease-related domain-containing protein [Williamsia sp. SKLECPSW1]